MSSDQEEPDNGDKLLTDDSTEIGEGRFICWWDGSLVSRCVLSIDDGCLTRMSDCLDGRRVKRKECHPPPHTLLHRKKHMC